MKFRYLFLLSILAMPCRAADTSTPLLPIDDPAIQRDLQAITQKIASITNPLIASSGTITQLQVSTITGVTSINGSFPNPNILINGGFEFWQRTSSMTTTVNATYGADRWRSFLDAGTSVTISTDNVTLDAGTYAMSFKLNSVGAATYAGIFQGIENFADYRGKTLSASVRVKATTGVKLFIYDGTFSFSAAHSGGNTFETLTVTKTISASAGTLSLTIGYDAADGGGVSPSISTSYFDSVMLVVGSQPIVFIPKDTQVELAQCQRYYEKSYALLVPPGSNTGLSGDIEETAGAQIAATTVETGLIYFKVQKRTIPTIALFNGDGTSGTWSWYSTISALTSRTTTASTKGTKGFSVTHGTAVEYLGLGQWTADAEM